MEHLITGDANHGVASVLRLGLGLPPDLEEQLIVEVTERLLDGWSPPPEA